MRPEKLSLSKRFESYIIRQGDRVHVTARLLRVHDGQSLWSGKFDEAFSDIFGVQDLIAQRVTETLAPHLSPTAPIVRWSRRTENAEAYQLFTEGFYNQQRRDKDGLPDAVRGYEGAILLDPGYVDAWGDLSSALALQGVFGSKPPAEVFPRAKQAALKALELDPESAEAHAAFAHMLVVYDREFKLADEHYSIAKRLNPAVPEFYLLARLTRSISATWIGPSVNGHAIELEPASLLFRSNLGMMLYLNRNYDQAERELRRVIQLQPQFDRARGSIGKMLVARGDYGARSSNSPRAQSRPAEVTPNRDERSRLWAASTRHSKKSSGFANAARKGLQSTMNSPPSMPRLAMRRGLRGNECRCCGPHLLRWEHAAGSVVGPAAHPTLLCRNRAPALCRSAPLRGGPGCRPASL